MNAMIWGVEDSICNLLAGEILMMSALSKHTQTLLRAAPFSRCHSIAHHTLHATQPFQHTDKAFDNTRESFHAPSPTILELEVPTQ